MRTFLSEFFIKLRARKVGRDSFGNRYYESRKEDGPFNRRKRWVVYNGLIEASKVPPQWYNWLHYQINEIPSSNHKQYDWEVDYVPNLTGTTHAYFPRGHVLAEGKRAKATGDYQRWKQED